jgi:hypothetical protein
MKRMGTLLLLAGSVLLMTGCDKVSKKLTSEDSCSSEVAKTTIRDMFVDAVEQSARDENKQHGDDPNALRFDLAKIRATTSQTGVAITDVITTSKDPNSSKKFCEAQLTLTIPEAVLADANALRKEVGEKTIQNLAEDESYRVDLNKFNSKINYSVQPTDAGDKLYTEVTGINHFTDLLAVTVKYAAIKVLRAQSQGASTQKAQEALAQQHAAATTTTAEDECGDGCEPPEGIYEQAQNANAEQDFLQKIGKSAPGTLLQLPKNVNLRAGPASSQTLVAQLQKGSQIRVLKDRAIRSEDDGTQTPWLAVELAQGPYCAPADIGALAVCQKWTAGRPISGWLSSKAFLNR